MTGTVVARLTFAGTILSTGIPPVTFTSTCNAEFDRPAQLSAVAGTNAGRTDAVLLSGVRT